jgi:hypothetical protein
MSGGLQAEKSFLSPSTPMPDNLSAQDLDRLRFDLDFMMAHYEGELKKPIRNLVSGRLPRTLLIQARPSAAAIHLRVGM